MRRRHFLRVLGGSTVAWPTLLRAQQARKVWRIGILLPRAASADVGVTEFFREGMRQLGYEEPKDFVLEERQADGEYERLLGFAQELVRLEVDIILAIASVATRAAQKATKTVPIVMVSGDPVANGLIVSLAHPEGNTTGLSLLSPDLSTKHLQFMAALLPRLSRVAVLTNPRSSTRESVLNSLENAGRTTGIKILSIGADTVEALEPAFEKVMREGAEAIIIVPDGFLIGQGHQIADLANQRRLPSIGANSEFAQRGGLLSYGTDITSLYKRSATFVQRIMLGAKVKEIPVEQPTKFELLVNLKTAKAMGLEIPQTLLAVADNVIE